MSQLALYSQFNLQTPYRVEKEFDTQSKELAGDGIILSKWPVLNTLPNALLEKAQVLRLYNDLVNEIKQQHNFLYADVACLHSSCALSLSMRGQYLSEHTHCEDEARFFIDGKVLVYVHCNERIHIIECGKGDFLLIPRAVKHWMDIGPSPNFTSIRWYNSKQGLSNSFTGSYVAESTPRWETIYGEDHFAIDSGQN